jgi:hypothetical protein
MTQEEGLLGSGKCKCLNKKEKDYLNIAIFRAIQLFSERMKLEEDPEMKESYNEDILEFRKLKKSINNTHEC